MGQSRPIDRRDVLRLAGMGAAAAALGPRIGSVFGGTSAEAAARGATEASVLQVGAKEAPIDHIVVLMMENRSFDHFLGWLASDDQYFENGRRRFGKSFHITGDQHQTFANTHGAHTQTYYLPSLPGEANPYRPCGHPDPGHGWYSGRAQRDRGFLGEGAHNDILALGYYDAPDVPFYADLARRFTVCDRYHASLLGPTFPNREYLHSAQSGGHKTNYFPYDERGFSWPTIWDRLNAAGVPAANYAVDLPTIALWGPRLVQNFRHIEAYFADCAAGTLPNVTFVDPGFTTGLRTDDHPYADIRNGQKYVFDVFNAFVNSPLWERGAFILTYDEWGGFFDHVPPPRLPDDRASRRDKDDFAQSGFRVPTIIASPYARHGFVDHTLYDHTSILRFIEWRFLGAPAHGTKGNRWWLTKRDRTAHNIGGTLRPDAPDLDVGFDTLPQLPISSAPCEGKTFEGFFWLPGPTPSSPVAAEKHAFEAGLDEGYYEHVGYPIDLRPLPV
jgi:phospholipase C